MMSIVLRCGKYGVFALLLLGLYRAAENRCAAVDACNVLTLREGRFFLDGKPFAEIGFNKFDLFWTIWQALRDAEKPGPEDRVQQAVASQAAVLRDLHELGFRTLRFFACPPTPASAEYQDPAAKARWFAALDRTLELCERHQIGVVFSLGAGAFCDRPPARGKPAAADREGLAELVGQPNSRSRTTLYAYLDEVVARYKDRPSIVMWEVTNELTNMADIGRWQGAPTPTLAQVAEFYDSVGRRIKQHDPVRLVSNGGSHLREHAWNLHLGNGWRQRDTLDQQRQALEFLFARSAIDVVDVHFYAVRQGGFEILGANGQTFRMGLAQYRDLVAGLPKGLYIGEYGTLPAGWTDTGKVQPADADWFDGYHDPLAEKWVRKAVDDVLAAGVPLVHFWTYASHRPQDQKPNPITFSREGTPNLMQIICAGNRRLKQKLGAE